jgi:hypothetical protein
MRLPTLLLVATALGLAGCGIATSTQMPKVKGSGIAGSATRPLDGVTSVRLQNVGKLIVKQGERPNVTIAGDDNIVPLVRTEVADGVLSIALTDEFQFETKNPLTYTLEVPNLASASVEGAAELAMDWMPAKEFRLKVDAAGNARLSGTCEKLTVDLSGAAVVRVSGSCDELNATLKEAAKLEAPGLKTRTATVTCSGAGQASVHVTESLTAKAEGAGRVDYRGPAKVASATSGAGTVTGSRD